MAEETRNFKFYENFLNAIELLPEGEREKACYEFCKFGITGELPDDKNLAMFCLGVSVSVQKYQGRGGNRNPKGNNQYTLGQRGQRGQKGLNGLNGLNEQTETETKTETETERKEKEINKEKGFYTNQQIEQAFDEFYACYPRKTGKAKAKERFENAIKTSKDANIIQAIQHGVKCYSDEIIANKTEQQFIKHPATWLNQKCWIDYTDCEASRFSGDDEYRLLFLQDCVLKTVPLTDSERKEVEEEIAILKRKKEQCQCAILQ